MEYRKIEGCDKLVSSIFYGTATPPINNHAAGFTELLDHVIAMGVNALDLARVYGDAERSVGDWMRSRRNRHEVVLLTKGCHPNLVTGRKRVNAAAIQKDLERSLLELRTDYIDIYLLHRDDPDTDVAEIVEALNTMKKAGKIGAFGGSNWTHRRIAEANAYAKDHGLSPFTVSSPNFGLAEQVRDPWGGSCVTISGKEGEEARDWYRQEQMPIIAYSSLGHGFFSGKLKSDDEAHPEKVLDRFAIKGYCSPENFERLRRCELLAKEKGVTVPEVAMAWIYRQDLPMFALVSTTKTERMEANIRAMELPLTQAECQWLNLEREKV